MKHFLFISCCLAAFSLTSISVYAKAANEEEIVLNETISGDRELPDNNNTEPSTVPRTPLFKPAYAYLSGSTVSIDFTVTFSTVVVTVTQAVTGEVVATRTLFNPSTLNLSLEGASSGEYLLAIEADAILLEGSFTL